jgi:phosphatidylinositol phospholipase C delta
LIGSTLTKSVGFEICIKAIKENAFKASNYPVIITIENHLKSELQKQAASVSLATPTFHLHYSLSN